MDLPVLVDWRVENMRASFRDLSNTVRTALRIHIGDRHRLNTVCEEVILLSETVEQVSKNNRFIWSCWNDFRL